MTGRFGMAAIEQVFGAGIFEGLNHNERIAGRLGLTKSPLAKRFVSFQHARVA